MFKKINLLELFCDADDFCVQFESHWNQTLIGTKFHKCKLSMGEILCILIVFQFSGFKDFKSYYKYLQFAHRKDFPMLLSYNRFIEVKQHYIVPFVAYLNYLFGECTGTSFVDSTPVKVCHNKRIHSNKVFKKSAKRGKSTMGWFFGFKLHIVVNHLGELLNIQITKGNVDDKKVIPSLCKKIKGLMFGDKGYISQKLFEEMLENGLRIVTALRAKMKPKIMVFEESELLKKRSMIESIFHILKDVLTLNHTRHRSQTNFMINIIGALSAYCLYPNKPAIKLASRPAASSVLIFN